MYHKKSGQELVKKQKGLLCLLLGLMLGIGLSGSVLTADVAQAASEDEIVLRVCNWEEYIDLGDWNE